MVYLEWSLDSTLDRYNPKSVLYLLLIIWNVTFIKYYQIYKFLVIFDFDIDLSSNKTNHTYLILTG